MTKTASDLYPPNLIEVAEIVMQLEGEWRRRQLNEHGSFGWSSGFKDLDSVTRGLWPGSLAVIAGCACAGKTSFALKISTRIAFEMELPVLFFTLDSFSAHIVERLVCQIGEFDSYLLREGKLGPKDKKRFPKAVKKLKSAPIFIEETPWLTATAICSRARTVANNLGQVGLIVVDNLQSLGDLYLAKNYEASCDEALSTLRDLALELHVPVIVLSNLPRKLEKRKDKRPRLTDVSAAAEVRRSDQLLFIYRDENYHPDSLDTGTADIIVARNRYGSIGTVRLQFDGPSMNFRDI